MKVKTYGTRGSLPVFSPLSVQYGGNTTCLRVYSDCLPTGMALSIDAGTGFLPMSLDALKEKVAEIVVLHTHYHHDHTQGLLIAPPIFMPDIQMRIYGPVEAGWDPRKVYQTIMQPVLHPVHLNTVAHHVTFHKIENPTIKVFAIHPKGGLKFMEIEAFRRLTAERKHLPFQTGVKYPVEECLVATMHYAEHPERTIAYRFEERPTGRVFVFLTDQECLAALPQSMRQFLKGAHLLIQDAQYSQPSYEDKRAGFGHGTPTFVTKTAQECGITRVGLFHHDPLSTDQMIEALVKEGFDAVPPVTMEVFGCHDYDEFEI